MRQRLSDAESPELKTREDSLQPPSRNVTIDENLADPAARKSTLEAPSTPTTLRRPSVLENRGYTIGRTIGNGSYATVKLAYSEKHGCNVAVKIIAKYYAPNDYLTKFLPREVEVVKGLTHPHIIHFLEAIETTHRVYIVMEYAENGSLLDIVRRDGHIDEERARKWFRQLAQAISHCHERGVVHRDIKCENLLMDLNYNIKLSDFGFARFEPEPFGTGLCNTFCGSYAYAPPEILRGIPYQPKHSDVWSMGVVLFAMIYGRLPFDDGNYSLLLKQVQRKVEFPSEPEVSTSCKALISRILAPLRVRAQLSTILSDPWLSDETEPSPVDTRIDREERTSESETVEVADPEKGIDTPTENIREPEGEVNASEAEQEVNASEAEQEVNAREFEQEINPRGLEQESNTREFEGESINGTSTINSGSSTENVTNFSESSDYSAGDES